MKIKIIRKIENGPEQGKILEARLIPVLFGNNNFQILEDGDFLGYIINWIDAVVVEVAIDLSE